MPRTLWKELSSRSPLQLDKPPALLAAGLDFRRFIALALLSTVALAAGSALGNIHAHSLRERLTALVGAAAFLLLAVAATRALAGEVDRVVAGHGGTTAGTAIRWVVGVAGYTVATFVTLGMLSVPVQHLLLGGALTGVVLGIAAQQSLGNTFAGVVLLVARPFSVGDEIRVRSGALGGQFDGMVTGMSLTYVSMDTSDGPLKVPNSALLAAAVGPRRSGTVS